MAVLRTFLVAVAILIAWPAIAQAGPIWTPNPQLVVVGGSPAQQAAVRSVVESCRVAGIHATVSIERMQDVPFRVAATAAPGLIRVKAAYDNLRPENRVRYEWGENSPIFRDIIRHELGHIVLFALSPTKQHAWDRRVRMHPASVGWPAPGEGFAENFRLTMFPVESLWRTTTVSPIPMLPEAEFLPWVEEVL